MKTIVKTEANRCLQEAQARGRSWDDFHDNAHDEYLAVREQALSDQRNECAYTGLWIGEGTIEMYNLNAQELIRRRKGIIENVRSLQQLGDEEVRQCMATAGFSFVVEFELRHREESA